ncbi:helix-turn-helix transcriptional regulator [Mobilicoccus pelagius]|uniref:Proteasome accessory factor B n=1 Tax=Mobilicoccus pelagius NBRC 104925 TaxID=1089455 RepID=H5UTF6_9MICO|nr:WYL domain-containing protein [Mobilicoccus pelagius]GAB49014.1 proteasome accessory factor B [Mobilicoccus pelagius NBRC 104925]
MRTAVVTARPVRFSYRGRRGEVTQRHVQPWGITAWHGHWYLTGFDVDRGEPRVFRLDRVTGSVAFAGAPGSYEIPDDHDPRAVVASSLAGGEPVTACLRLRPGRGNVLRRGARVLPPEETATLAPSCAPGTTDWDVVEVVAADASALADEVLGHGADVAVAAPDSLRDLVRRRLQAVVTAHEAPEVPETHDAGGTA